MIALVINFELSAGIATLMGLKPNLYYRCIFYVFFNVVKCTYILNLYVYMEFFRLSLVSIPFNISVSHPRLYVNFYIHVLFSVQTLMEDEERAPVALALSSWGCCVHCVLRFLGERGQATYRLPRDVRTKYTDCLAMYELGIQIASRYTN